MTKHWRVLATYQQPDDTDEDQLSAFTAALPGYGITVCDGTTIHAEMTIEATTIRQAADGAFKAARAAHVEAFGHASEPAQLRILTLDDYDHEIAHPPGEDLVGVHEAAEILGVSKQRVGQLARREDFPEPLVTLRSGPVWTKPSITVFDECWDRKPGRPRKTPPAGA